MKTDKNWNTEAVPTHIWNNIEQELDKKNKKAIIWWRLAGVLVLAITSFGVARYLMDGTTKTNELAIVKPIEKIKPITLNQETLIDSIKDNYELEEEVVEEKIEQEKYKTDEDDLETKTKILFIDDTVSILSYNMLSFGRIQSYPKVDGFVTVEENNFS